MIGERCTIAGTELAGLIVGLRQYVGDQDRYAVRYFDMQHNPQERWFRADQLRFGGAAFGDEKGESA